MVIALDEKIYVFKKKKCCPPARLSKIGETRQMKCGMDATITAYRSAFDIDVEFADGQKRTGVNYGQFKRCEIKHPGKMIQTNLGQTKLMNCGLTAKIESAKNSKDISIVFEDGTRVDHTQYSLFCSGNIGHPGLLKEHRINNVYIVRMAYRSKGIPNYYCKCFKCGWYDIADAHEIIGHNCNKKD